LHPVAQGTAECRALVVHTSFLPAPKVWCPNFCRKRTTYRMDRRFKLFLQGSATPADSGSEWWLEKLGKSTVPSVSLDVSS